MVQSAQGPSEVPADQQHVGGPKGASQTFRGLPGGCAQIQVLRPVHYLHPRAVMLVTLYESLTGDPHICNNIPPRLLELLEYHRTLVLYDDDDIMREIFHGAVEQQQVREHRMHARADMHAQAQACLTSCMSTSCQAFRPCGYQQGEVGVLCAISMCQGHVLGSACLPSCTCTAILAFSGSAQSC